MASLLLVYYEPTSCTRGGLKWAYACTIVLCASDNEQYSSALASTEDEEHYNQVELALRIAEPAMVVLRNTDAKQGKSLGYVYHGMLTLDAI